MTPIDLVTPVIALLPLIVAIMAIGSERQKRVDLEKRHAELAKESRHDIGELRAKMQSLDVANARNETTVAELKHSMSRVESAISRMADRLDEVLAERSGLHDRR